MIVDLCDNLVKQYINNTVLANYLPRKELEVTKEKEVLEDKGVYFELRNEADTAQIITMLDIQICDAVYSIYMSGHEYFSIENICRVLSGDFQQKITEEMKNTIGERIEALCLIELEISDPDNSFCEMSYFLDLERLKEESIIFATNGKKAKTKVYRIRDLPLIFIYAERLKQIISLDGKLLTMVNHGMKEKKKSNTLEFIQLKRYLLKRIFQMARKGSYQNSNKIALEWLDNGKRKGLYADLGYHEENYKNWKVKKSHLLNDIETVLYNLKREKIVKNFCSYRENHSKNPNKQIKGYLIEL